MGDGADDAPDWKHNVLRDRLGTAASAATHAAEAIGASTSNPLTALASKVAGAWTAPGSRARSNLLDDLAGAGAGIRSAFDNAHDDLAHAQSGEPVRIDVKAHPELAWKTTASGIDRRSYGSGHGPW